MYIRWWQATKIRYRYPTIQTAWFKLHLIGISSCKLRNIVKGCKRIWKRCWCHWGGCYCLFHRISTLFYYGFITSWHLIEGIGDWILRFWSCRHLYTYHSWRRISRITHTYSCNRCYICDFLYCKSLIYFCSWWSWQIWIHITISPCFGFLYYRIQTSTCSKCQEIVTWWKICYSSLIIILVSI